MDADANGETRQLLRRKCPSPESRPHTPMELQEKRKGTPVDRWAGGFPRSGKWASKRFLSTSIIVGKGLSTLVMAFQDQL